MKILEILLWAFLATGFLTTLLTLSRTLHLTRMDIPLMLGALVTEDRDRAKIIGFVIHFFNGWWMALIYVAFFNAFGFATWWFGALMGLAHAAFVLIVVLPLLPGGHSRMASDYRGPKPTPLLEPPGFLAMNYGYRTPVATIIAHLVYGTMLGACYRV